MRLVLCETSNGRQYDVMFDEHNRVVKVSKVVDPPICGYDYEICVYDARKRLRMSDVVREAVREARAKLSCAPQPRYSRTIWQRSLELVED